MPARHIFVDTNILIYAHDTDAGKKRLRAMELIEALINGPYPPAVSVQILNELYVNLQRLSSSKVARTICESYLDWEIVPLSLDIFRGAIDLSARYKLSFWDASVLQAALKARAEVVVSEDLSHVQFYETLQVVNPFKLGEDWKTELLG